ncbi:MAG: hypothetical protein R3B06_05735 [Kofleriaceae bacterium]
MMRPLLVVMTMAALTACLGARPALMALTPMGGDPRNPDPTANPTATTTGGRYVEATSAAGPVSNAPAVAVPRSSAQLRCQGVGLAALAAAVLVGVTPLFGVSGTFEETPGQPRAPTVDRCGAASAPTAAPR